MAYFAAVSDFADCTWNIQFNNSCSCYFCGWCILALVRFSFIYLSCSCAAVGSSQNHAWPNIQNLIMLVPKTILEMSSCQRACTANLKILAGYNVALNQLFQLMRNALSEFQKKNPRKDRTIKYIKPCNVMRMQFSILRWPFCTHNELNEVVEK